MKIKRGHIAAGLVFVVVAGAPYCYRRIAAQVAEKKAEHLAAIEAQQTQEVLPEPDKLGLAQVQSLIQARASYLIERGQSEGNVLAFLNAHMERTNQRIRDRAIAQAAYSGEAYGFADSLNDYSEYQAIQLAIFWIAHPEQNNAVNAVSLLPQDVQVEYIQPEQNAAISAQTAWSAPAQTVQPVVEVGGLE
jgi:hypothetical protein